MKRTVLLICSLVALSFCSGYLMSEATWISRVGITFFHRAYNFTKVWWQGAIAVFIILLLLFLLHTLLHRLLPIVVARVLHFILLLAATTGLYFTYDDFHHDLSHRMLGWRFHYGFYLVWTGWILIGISFLFRKKIQKKIITGSDNKGTITQ